MGQRVENGTPASGGTGLVGRLIVTAIVLALLLFVVAVWLMPGPRSRGPAKRTMCSNNLHNMGLAIHEFYDVQNRLPGYVEVEIVGGVPQQRPGLLAIFEYMELTQYKLSIAGYPGHGMNPNAELPYMPWRLCPSTVGYEDAKANATSYLFNTGLPDGVADATTPADWPANGVFHSLYPLNDAGQPIAVTQMSLSDIADGTATTLMLAETAIMRRWTDLGEAQVGFVWHPMLHPPDAARLSTPPRWGGDPYIHARPSSNHNSKGPMAAFADASVNDLNSAMDYRVYCQLMAPHDAEVRPPGVNSNMQIPDEIRTTPLGKEEY